MGRYSQDNHHTTTTTSEVFQAAEALAFDRASKALSAMPFASLADLEQAGCSYYAEGFRLAGVSVSGEYIQRKAAKLAGWWDKCHTAKRTRRPHTRYSPAMAARGRVVAALRKTARNDWTALRVQLERDRGATVAEVAGELGCSNRFIYKLSKRKFPKLVAFILVMALGVNVGNSSGGESLSQKPVDTAKEGLRLGTLDEGTPAHPPPLGKTDEIDAIGERIGDILRQHWRSSGL